MPRPFRVNGPAVRFSVFIFGVISISIFSCQARAARADNLFPGSATVVEGPTGQKIDSFLTNISAFGYSGAMLVVQNDTVILCKGYGYANVPGQIPNVAETVFDIGSFAKQITAAAVLILQDRGKLNITDKLEKFFPEAPEDKRSITVEQLLSHTSGLDRDFPFSEQAEDYYEDVGHNEAVKRILALPLIDEPGKQFAYSNNGYVLLASIIESTGGVPFQEFLKSNIFELVGMHSTGFWGSQLPDVPDSLIAYGYDEYLKQVDPRVWSDSTWMDKGGGEMVSTIGDLYKWCQTCETDILLSDSARRRMFTPGMGDYGFGAWIRKTPRSTTVIEHGGDYIGFGMKLAWYRDESTVVINLTNRNHRDFGNHHVVDKVVPQMLFGDKEYHMYVGEEFEMPPASMPLDTTAINEFAGTYLMDSGGKFVIQQFGNELSIGAVGQDAINILAPASEEELTNRDHLTQMTDKLMTSLAAGDSNSFTQDMLRIGASAEIWNTAMIKWLVDLQEDSGSIKEISILGTVPGAYPKGDQQTGLFIQCENGTDNGMFDRVDNRIIGIRGTPRLFAEVPLRRSVDKGLVGWSITWFKGFSIEKSRENSEGQALELTLRNKNTQVQARRITT